METKNYKLKIFILFGIIMLMLSSLMACTDNNENSYPLPNVAEGDMFEITLDSYGSTAYSWSYKINTSVGIEYVTMEYVTENNDSDTTGGGKLIYTFKAIKAGNYKIEFKLQIPWESEPPIKTNLYKIKIVK